MSNSLMSKVATKNSKLHWLFLNNLFSTVHSVAEKTDINAFYLCISLSNVFLCVFPEHIIIIIIIIITEIFRVA